MADQRRLHSIQPLWLRAALFCLAYFASAELGDSLSFQSSDYATFWPPSGLFVAALLLSETRAWPVLILAALPANITFDLLHGRPLWVSFIFCCGNSLEALAGAWLVRRFVSQRLTLSSVRQVLGLVGLSALLSTALGATVGASVVTLAFGRESFWMAWRVWWVGGILGVLVIAPFILTWAADGLKALRRPHPGRVAEGALLLAGLSFCVWLIFARQSAPQSPHDYLMIPFLAWAALRFGLRGAATANLGLSLFAMWGTSRGYGEYAVLSIPVSQQVLSLQAFLGVTAFTALALAAILAERQQVEEALARRARELMALHETSLEINAQPDLSTLLGAIVERAAGLAGARIGGLYLMRPDGETLQLAVGHNLPEGHIGTILRLGEGLSGRIAQTGEPMMIGDYLHWEGRASVYADSPFCRVLGVPLKIGKRIIGVINVTDDEQTGPYSDEEVRLATLFANQAAIAIENARLYEAAQFELAERQRADEALRQAHEQLEATLNALPDLLFEVDREGRIYDYRAPRSELLYVPPAEFLGKMVAQVLPKQAANVITGAIARAVEHGHDSGAIYSLEMPQGVRWFELSIAARGDLKSPDGRLIALARDITERKQAEEALRESEERYRHIVEYSPVGIGIASPDGKVIAANRAMQVITGYSLEELVEINLADIYEDKDRQALIEAVNRSGSVVDFPAQLKRKDGTPYDALLSVTRISLGGRQVLHTMCQDITERQRAEEALKRHTAQLALLNDVGQKIAAVLELDSVLDRAAYLVRESFGYHHVALFTMSRERGELLMTARAGDFARLFPPDHRLTLGQGMVGWVGRHGEKLLANDVRAEPRYVNLYPDVIPTRAELSVPIRVGQEIVGVLDVQSSQLNAFDEGDVMVMETLADQIAVAVENARLYEAVRQELVERTRVEQQLKVSLKEKDVLLKEIQHRVKNNLQVIHSMLSLQAGHIQDPRALEAFRESQDRIRSMALVHERLYQSRDLAQIDFADYVQDLTLNLLHSYGVDPEAITLEVSVEAVSLGVDKAIPCGLIVNELVSNCLKHAFPPSLSPPPQAGRTEGGRRIRVEICPSDGGLALMVSDNGIGIPQGLDVRKAKSLGLQLVTALVEQLRGTLELDSGSGGTMFKIVFAGSA